MAMKKNVGQKPTNVEHKPTETAPKFTIERLGEDCMRLFGVGIAEYAGATYGLKGKYTVQEMKDQIKKWKEMEVK